MDAMLLLQSEHEVVKSLFEMIAQGPRHGADRRRMLLNRMADVLRLHSAVECELMSRVLSRSAARRVDEVLIHACLQQHQTLVHWLLPGCIAVDVESAAFEGRMNVLGAAFETLCREEEERLFALVARTLTPSEIADIGREIGALELLRYAPRDSES
jgi:hypothetical protein